MYFFEGTNWFLGSYIILGLSILVVSVSMCKQNKFDITKKEKKNMKTKEWKWKPNENEKVNPNTHLRYPIQPVAVAAVLGGSLWTPPSHSLYPP